MSPLALGVDVGTSSTKGVLVDEHGRIRARATRAHDVRRPRSGHVEMDAETWWEEFVAIAAELTRDGEITVDAVGVSGMGPCVVLTDESGLPLRPAILYGVDTRAGEQIARLTRELGADAILERGGSHLTSQAVGPKLLWVAENEPEVARRARRLFMPASWLAYCLTGEYRLDVHSASQCTPLFDRHSLSWYEPWARLVAPDLPLPRLGWPGEVAGTARGDVPGIPAGTPVTIGTIDAWTEALSVGAASPGDLMLMYGTTMFLVATTAAPAVGPGLWGTCGVLPGTWSLAGGMATSGAVTAWITELTGADHATLSAEAVTSGPGARGILMLPYFAGERTPLDDPAARGEIVGLSLEHTRGDLYRAALEATGFAVRHILEALAAAGVDVSRAVAVGGGASGGLWPRVVSDITGIRQALPAETVGASLGAAFLAHGLLGSPRIEDWNPSVAVLEPDPSLRDLYDLRYRAYRDLYPATRAIVHALPPADAPTPPSPERTS